MQSSDKNQTHKPKGVGKSKKKQELVATGVLETQEEQHKTSSGEQQRITEDLTEWLK